MIFQNTFCKNIVNRYIRTFTKDTSYKNKLTYFHKNTQTNKIYKNTSYKNQVENNNVSNTSKKTRKNITSFKDKLNNTRMDDYDEYYTNRIIKNGGL
tara:strand:- start:5534 stop:5824 length:291 start_codon:yes stop_codon:yes gene_type:complete